MTDSPSDTSFSLRRTRRRRIGVALAVLFFIATVFGVIVLATLLVDVTLQALPWLNSDFLTSLTSRFPEKAGVRAAIS